MALRMRTPPPPRPAPDARSLHEAALAYLARYAATEGGLTRMLARKIDRWARNATDDAEAIARVAATARAAIAPIVARLAASGAVSDPAFAQSRARSLSRAGRSSRAIGAKLVGKGVPAPLARAAAQQDDHAERAAALIHIRKRRMGPFRTVEAAPDARRRELASLARAGFSHAVASHALDTDREEADAIIAAFRAAL